MNERSKSESAEGAEVTGAPRVSRLNQLTEQIIGAAIMDLLVEDSVVLELKTVDQLLPVHSAQLLTYLKLSGKKVGLLINFNEPILTKGLKRLVNQFTEPTKAPVTSAPSAFSDFVLSFLTLRLCVSAVKSFLTLHPCVSAVK